MDGFELVARLEDLPEGEPLGVETEEGDRLCLVRVDEETIYAFQDNCSHRDFPLSSGRVEDRQIECAWHGARFDMETGKALCLPAIRPIRTYEVRIEDGGVYVAVL